MLKTIKNIEMFNVKKGEKSPQNEEDLKKTQQLNFQIL